MPKNAGVEQLDAVEDAARRHVGRIVRWRRRDRRIELVAREDADRLAAVAQVVPERLDVGARRGSAGHADDGDRLVGVADASARARASARRERSIALRQRRRCRCGEERRRRDLGRGRASRRRASSRSASSELPPSSKKPSSAPDLIEAEHLGERARRSPPRDRRAGRGTAAPAPVARSSARAAAARSSLPLAVTGSAASVTNAAGTMNSGSSVGELRAQHRRRGLRRVRRHDVGDQPLAHRAVVAQHHRARPDAAAAAPAAPRSRRARCGSRAS